MGYHIKNNAKYYKIKGIKSGVQLAIGPWHTGQRWSCSVWMPSMQFWQKTWPQLVATGATKGPLISVSHNLRSLDFGKNGVSTIFEYYLWISFIWTITHYPQMVVRGSKLGLKSLLQNSIFLHTIKSVTHTTSIPLHILCSKKVQ